DDDTVHWFCWVRRALRRASSSSGDIGVPAAGGGVEGCCNGFAAPGIGGKPVEEGEGIPGVTPGMPIGTGGCAGGGPTPVPTGGGACGGGGPAKGPWGNAAAAVAPPPFRTPRVRTSRCPPCASV